jgi:transcriptional regulator with XRE-family HTH domain
MAGYHAAPAYWPRGGAPMPRIDPDDERLQHEHRILEALGRRLRARRADLELGIVELAERAGLSHSYISRIERGRIERPTLFELRKVATGYGLPLHTLVDDDTDTAESATGRGLRDAPELARVVDQIAASWPWVTEDVRAVMLAGLQAMAMQLEAQRQRNETPAR